MFRKIIIAGAAAAALTACNPQRAEIQHPGYGLGIALGYIVAAPVMILAGIAEGIATAPYFVQSDLHAMNKELVKANAPVDFERTYAYAYNADLSKTRDGDTGKVFRHLRPTTLHFQKVLRGYGVADPEHYVVTAVRTADRDGYTLYGLVYRPDASIRVKDRQGVIRTLTARDDAFYRPYARDAAGEPLDSVIDWAGVPRTAIATQKGQAILMTLAANSVLINRRSDEFWNIERRWRAGAYKAIADQRKASLDKRMS